MTPTGTRPAGTRPAGTAIAAAITALISALGAALLMAAALLQLLIQVRRPAVNSNWTAVLVAAILVCCAATQLVLAVAGAVALFHRKPAGRPLAVAGSVAGLAWVLAWLVNAFAVNGDAGVALVVGYCVFLPAVTTLVLVLLPRTRRALGAGPQRTPSRLEPPTEPIRVVPQRSGAPHVEFVRPPVHPRPPQLRLLLWCAATGLLFGAFGVLAACSPPAADTQLPNLPGVPERPDAPTPTGRPSTQPAPTGLPPVSSGLPTALPPGFPTDLPPGFPTELPPGLPTGLTQEHR
ncbi:hypothetical protein [Amycolatopsis nalaikhensis]|uniref:Uncharacterized protein n=1 Tax=Amycolatopsis nalaikhensis TaxID=715472 RepID=A0ABY8XU97_9PSEU|nr:hypothetical protein [Amycolatopsis sp. 2-2]WIV59228.1 hypothetical protein QP939_11655 [Amycolatopsis sp. 2-2]